MENRASIDSYDRSKALSNYMLRIFHHKIHNELPHKHNYFECVYIEKGSGFHIANGLKLPIKEGDFLIIDTDTVHDYESENDDLEVFNLIFVPEFIDKSLAHCQSFFALLNHYLFKLNIASNIFTFDKMVFHDDSRQIYKLFTLIYEEFEAQNTAYNEIIRCYLIEFLLKTLRSLDIFSQNSIHTTVLEVLRYIENNYASNISLSTICSDLNYSLPYLSKIIKQETGTTFIKHLQNTRINHACTFLLSTNKSISEICTLIGYSDIKHFNYIFKKTIGLSPSSYRNTKYKS